jgi:hypothetical protein
MDAILNEPLNSATAWKAEDLYRDKSWLYPLNDEQRDEIKQALATAKAKGCSVETVRPENFPLPGLVPTLNEMADRLDNDTGFLVLRGVPLDDLSLGEIELLYAGLTSHLGTLINQDTKGTLIDHVADRGADYSDISVRGYTTNAHLTPHCDSGDLVVLLCVRPAKSGGINNISSAMSIYNVIREDHPEYLEPLYRGFHYNIRGNGPIGPYLDITRHRVPVYSYYKGKLSCRYNQKAIKTAEELEGVEPLTDLEKRAIDCVAELAMRDDLRFDVMLERGDIAFLNNHIVLHNRSNFIDFEKPEHKRLLLRQWLNLYQARELTDEFADHYNTGPRMGPDVHGGEVGGRIR